MSESILLAVILALVAVGLRIDASLRAERRKVMQLLQQLDAERRFRSVLVSELARSIRIAGSAEGRLREVVENLAAASLAASALRAWTPRAETVPPREENSGRDVSERYADQ